MSLPRPRRPYHVTEHDRPNQEAPPSSSPCFVTDLVSFCSLAFELDVHFFSDSFHTEARPVKAGTGGTSTVRHFKLEFDDLGITQDDTYNDGRPMRGRKLSKGHRIITKHVVIGSDNLRNGQLDRAKVMRPLVQELRVLAHPPLRDNSNIVDLFGVAWEKSTDYFDRVWPILVLEYAPGGNLAEFLSLHDRQIIRTRWKKLLEDLASGLCLLHKCGITHADLKPENILVDIGADGQPIAKVCDFGFAVIHSDYDTAGASDDPEIQLTGFTPKWIAPEARGGSVQLSKSPSIDVYAFGLVAAFVASGGQDPFAIDGEVLTENIQAMKENEELSSKLMGTVQEQGYDARELRLISKVLHGTLAVAPSKRLTSEVIQHMIKSYGYEEQSEEAYFEVADGSRDSSSDSHGDSELEISHPFEDIAGELGIFEPDVERIDQLLFMPLDVQRSIYLDLKEKALSQTPIKAHDHSLSGSEVIDKEATNSPYLLSILLFEGLGGSQDLPEAVKWLEASARAGYTRAMLDLPRIFSAYQLEIPMALQNFIHEGLVQGAEISLSRFVLDTLEILEPAWLANVLDKIERRRRLCANLSEIWDISWFEALFDAYSDLCSFANHPIAENLLDLRDTGSTTVSLITADIDRFAAFLHDTNGNSREKRALKDYGFGLRWIHFLANFGTLEALKIVLKTSGVDVNEKDSVGRTALYFATACGNATMVEFLLDQNARADAVCDERGNTCLHFITSFRRPDIIKMVGRLIAAGADPNAQNRTGCTPLHMSLMHTASMSSNFLATDALLKVGADPCITDEDGETALYWAVIHQQPDALELLLNAVRVKFSESELSVQKANLFDYLLSVAQIDMASLAGSQFPRSLDRIVQLLLDKLTFEEYRKLPDNGGDSVFYGVAGRGKLELMRSICRCFPSVNVDEGEVEYSRPALQYAIRHNRPQVFKELLSLGANFFYQDTLGENAMHVAAAYAPDMVKMVLKRSEEERALDRMIHTVSIQGFTPFDKAVLAGHLATATILVQHGAKPDEYRILDGEGLRTTLLGHILSSPSASLQQIDFLLQFKPNSIVSEDSSTVFHALAQRIQSIQNDVSLDFEADSIRQTIFDVLYRAYFEDIYNLDSKGRTPLHIASQNVLFDLVVRLAAVGISVWAKDHAGHTALDYLRLRRQTQEVEERYILLYRSFERKMDELEAWLENKMS